MIGNNHPETLIWPLCRRLASILGLDFTLLLEWSAGNDGRGGIVPNHRGCAPRLLALPEDKVRALDFIQQRLLTCRKGKVDPRGTQQQSGSRPLRPTPAIGRWAS
jgi:hypothetical protein